MNYTDRELLRASQIAYFKIDRAVIEEVNEGLRLEGVSSENRNYTLSELYSYSEAFRESIYDNISNVSGIFENLEDVDRAMVLSRIESHSIRERVAEMYDNIDYIVNDGHGIDWQCSTIA